ncbi:ankyrin repeat domain-containing protein, partial [Wolbachia endosymbiont of Pentidionis agamae]|uniref:ankyrin repeat domain-containing protein n=1 Tax=Wolbachia endosymbiont of Pentidionis agamae TaxID=3110435 RepID=UPI002FD339BB
MAIKINVGHQSVHRIIEILLNAPQTDLNIKDDCGRSYVEYSFTFNKSALRRIAEKCRSVLSTCDKNKESILHLAVMRGYNDCIETLLDTRAIDVNLKDGYNLTALHYAITECRFSTIELLVRFGGDCNAMDNERDTPLHMALSNFVKGHSPPASYFEHSEAINKLMSKITFIKNDEKAYLAVAVYLIECGRASLSAKNKYGKTPFQLIPDDNE